MSAALTTMPAIGVTRDERHAYLAFYPPAPPIPLRSVTTILNVVAKEALLNWYAKIAAGWAVDNTELVLRMLADLGRDATVKAVAARGKAERDRKGAIGTAAHLAVEHHLAGMPPILTAETAPLFQQWLAFLRDWQFEPEWSEAMVVSERHGYAGTLDLIGRLAGKRALVDVKTGGFISPDMGLQLAAYSHADYIGKAGLPDRWKVPAVDLHLILQLQPTFYRLIPYTVGDAEMRAFLAAQQIDAWQRQEARKIMGQTLEKGMLIIA
ncbi:MAG: hypothetical protein ACOYBU_14110 [Dermatophilaceae bacterium]